MNDLIEFVKWVAARLESAGIEYMLTGSNAMSLYAKPRSTRDADFVIDPDTLSPDQLVKLFETECYVDQLSIVEAVATEGMFNIIHWEWATKADFVIRKNTAYRREEFARRKQWDVEGQSVSVVTPEDLILSKLAWAKDSESELQLGDVREIIHSVPSIDWEYVQSRAEALEVTHLLNRAREHE